MSKKWLIFILFFVLLSQNILAEQFDVILPESTLAIGNIAVIPIKITNLQSFEDKYIISVLDFNWLVESIDNATIASGKTETINLVLKASTSIEPKSYGVKINVKSITNKEIEQLAKIVVAKPESVFGIKIIGPESLDPRKDNKLTVEFENYYDNDFSTLNVILQNDIFTETKTISLKPREIKNEEFTIKLAEDAKEGDHYTNFIFYQDNSLVANQTVPIKVASYSGIRDVFSEEKGVLYQQSNIKKVNDGNSVGFQKYVKTFTLFERIFTSSEPAPDSIVKNSGVYVYTWDVRLQPGEEKDIKITTNYLTPLIVFILLVIVGILVYFRFKKDIVVSKKAIMITKEKGFSKMKVSITIFNKGIHTVNNLKVMERIPHITKEELDFDSTKPMKITPGINSLSIVWKVDEIKGREEKTISYSIGSKLHAVGRLNISPTLVKYIKGKNSVVAVSSGLKLLK
ncbi:MAG: hypothetical protein PHF86_05615 [Candidatus Nanoarchaeia archaeon]|nr:hypothetical protein [Candidatus Nanoarchaeia archaeon]